MKTNSTIFRAYDIRGDASHDLTDAFCQALGQAVAIYYRQHNNASNVKHPTFVIGKDCRLSSDRIYSALIQGLQTQGIHIIDLGMVPTPCVYFASHYWNSDGYIMITGSHNPATDNGFKIGIANEPISEQAILDLQTIIEQPIPDNEHKTTPDSLETRDVVPHYIDHIKNNLTIEDCHKTIVVDGGNGAAGLIATNLYEQLGFHVIPLYCTPDGTFPNHHPDPTIKENMIDLCNKVQETDAALGIAFDTDGDRIGIVDNHGRCLWGDRMMVLFAQSILKQIPQAIFVGEVKCSQIMFDEIEKAGGHAILEKVGHSYMRRSIKKHGASLAGEMSGHLFFADRYFGFDDAIYAGARMLEILSKDKRSLAGHNDTIASCVTTGELRHACLEHDKFDIVDAIAKNLKHHPDVIKAIDIDGIRIHFEYGWGLVRASNTGAYIVVRYEADNTTHFKHIKAIINNELNKAITTEMS